uniref:Acetolactate synthase small subunit n=1 Tax=uncultured bacterium F25-01 TaxID=1191433 RepID=I3VIG5_9BACT|nr:acetolactate synthase 3 regulatory subunit [uncultured bacterium F25-01]
MKRTVVAIMEDRPGVLNRVVSVLRRRSFNIDSLAVGHTDQPGISRMTIVVDGNDEVIEQVVKQLYKIIDIIKVSDVSEEKIVAHELALIKVATTSSNRAEIMQIADIYDAKIVDVALESLIVQVVGPDDKVDSLLGLMRGYGVKEVVRTGRVALVRGSSATRAPDEEPEFARPRGNSRALRQAV